MTTILEEKLATATSNTLRIYVDNTWTAREIIILYQSLQNIYDVYSYAELLLNSKNLNSKSYSDKELQVIGLIYQNILKKEVTIITNAEKHVLFTKKFSTQSHPIDIITPLVIKQISFASPGIHDIAGMGTIIGHIKEVFLKLFELKQNRARRKLEDEKLELENQLLYLDRNKKFIDILLEIGYSKDEVRKIISYENFNVNKLSDLIKSKKIDNVGLIN